MLLLVGVTACSESFQESDPEGFKACSTWSGYTSAGDPVSLVGGALEVADMARRSTTAEIRDSVSNLIDDDLLADAGGQQFGLLDRPRFEAACTQKGDFSFTQAD